jgi:hypothetical protein
LPIGVANRRGRSACPIEQAWRSQLREGRPEEFKSGGCHELAKLAARKQECVPPSIDGDFYRIANLLNDEERAVGHRVREFMEKEVAPIIEGYWARDKLPFEIIPQMAKLGMRMRRRSTPMKAPARGTR